MNKRLLINHSYQEKVIQALREKISSELGKIRVINGGGCLEDRTQRQPPPSHVFSTSKDTNEGPLASSSHKEAYYRIYDALRLFLTVSISHPTNT